MQVIKYPDPSTYKSILERPVMDNSEIEARVLPILQAVRTNGDIALKDFTHQFDKVELSDLRVSEEELKEAELSVPDELKNAINLAYINIFKFHEAQQQSPNP